MGAVACWLWALKQVTNSLGASVSLSVKSSSGPGFPGGSDGKESTCNARDLGLIPGSGRSPGEGKGYPLQYSCLDNFMDRGAWQAAVHGFTKSWTRLND